MNLEAWSTVATFGTFIVIGVTAIAAMAQLRHIRRANQLAGLQNVFGMLTDPEVRDLVNFVRHDLGDRMMDERFRRTLLEIPIDRREHPEFYLCDIYNHIGSFVRGGLIDEALYMQTDWYNVLLYWELLTEVVAVCRHDRPHTFENFEWLASRARRWRDVHPSGDYPPGEPRMPLTRDRKNPDVDLA